jgi:site-specific DNA-methyltransferase (adenine-specific)
MSKSKVKKLPKKGPLAFDTVYHGDSLAGMRLVKSESIDLVITSPPYADMKVYEGGFGGFHPDEYVRWFLPYVAEIGRILKPTGSFILNINDKSIDGFRHPFIFELIYAIHNAKDYCKLKGLEELDMHGLRMFERLFWNKGKFLAHPSRFGDKIEYLFWFSRTKDRKFNIDPMRLKYDEKSVKRMQRPLLKRFVRESGEEVTEYKQGGEGSWAPNEQGALPSVLIEEGAMLHVRPVVENLPEGTVLIGERLDDSIEVIQPQAGDEPPASTVVTIGSESRRIAGNHVAVYPERLVNYFIQGSTEKGDVVLDPFMGTGTTAVVAKALNRQYVGFDISADYVKTANARIKAGPYLKELNEKKERTSTVQTRLNATSKSKN